MSFRRRHRWLRRLALGLAVFGAVAAGNAGYALAKGAPGTSTSHYVSTPGWSGLVDDESGIPLSAGIPEGDEPFVVDEMQVIPYLSHGILTEAQRDAALADAVHDPYLTDVFSRPGEAATGPDGMSVNEQWTVVPYLSQGILTAADRDAAAAEAIRDPLPTRAEQERFVPGVTDFPRVSVDVPAIRPDDARNRFAHSDVAGRPELAGGGSTFELDDALTVGIGALVLALGLGLALGVLRRPRLVGF